MIYDPVSRRCTTANAGHTPPAFVTPDGAVRFHPHAQNPPLGFGSAPFATTSDVLPEGSVIALYTDGLLDLRRHEADAAIAALAAALLPAHRDLDEICDRLSRALPGEHDDDVALLLARTRALPADHVAAWDFDGGPEDVASARALVARQLTDWGLQEHVFATEVVVSELLTNAVRHARPPVRVRLIRDAALICEVTDASSTAPHLRKAQPMDEGGRGLFLVGQLTDRWGTRSTEDGKTIWAEKRLT
jgi:anti-sigma regulatory factor (Ser/Thr protein kinase)